MEAPAILGSGGVKKKNIIRAEELGRPGRHWKLAGEATGCELEP